MSCASAWFGDATASQHKEIAWKTRKSAQKSFWVLIHHLDVHVGVVTNIAGRLLGTLSVGTLNEGYRQLLCWAQAFVMLRHAGVEGMGSYGSALTHVLQSNGATVIEINRPDRSRRRGRGKSDATDAESAARSVLAGNAKASSTGAQRFGRGVAHVEPGTPQRS